MLYVFHGPEETKRFAAEKAHEWVRQHGGAPLVIALEGELGAGKTTFARAFSRALGVAEPVKSPTFLVMKRYDLESVPGYSALYHFDCYRLAGPEDLNKLGIEEVFKTHGNIVLVEWSDRVVSILPQNHITIHIDHVADQVRNIHIHEEVRPH